MIQSELERQLLPDLPDTDRVYVEFNLAEKLKGSFEEQAASLQSLVGRPVMTANEGRARLNLPRIDNPSYDELADQQGGPASTAVDPTEVRPSVASIVRSHWDRQAARLQKVPTDDQSRAFVAARWRRELATDLTPVLGAEPAFLLAARITDDTDRLLQQGANPFALTRKVRDA
jgi:hypothetical protein